MNSNLAYQEDLREEKIDGQIVVMSPRPAWNHASVAGNIYGIFFNYLDGKKCTPIMDGVDLYLDDDNWFIPDFMVVCDPDKIKSDGVHGAPDLVVEVLSPSTAKTDKTRKKEAYARAGVREYWLVSPTEKFIEIYYNADGEFVLHDIYTLHADWQLKQMREEERAALVTHFKCSLYDDLEIPIAAIFKRTF